MDLTSKFCPECGSEIVSEGDQIGFQLIRGCKSSMAQAETRLKNRGGQDEYSLRQIKLKQRQINWLRNKMGLPPEEFPDHQHAEDK